MEKSVGRERESKVSEEDVKTMFRSIDKDNSGEITIMVAADFCEAFRNTALQRTSGLKLACPTSGSG